MLRDGRELEDIVVYPINHGIDILNGDLCVRNGLLDRHLSQAVIRPFHPAALAWGNASANDRNVPHHRLLSFGISTVEKSWGSDPSIV